MAPLMQKVLVISKLYRNQSSNCARNYTFLKVMKWKFTKNQKKMQFVPPYKQLGEEKKIAKIRFQLFKE